MSDNTCLDFSAGFQFRQDCVGVYVAKLIGIVILIGSFALKVPQIYNIFSTKNVVGLSPSSFYTDCAAVIVTVVYNILQGNPFTSFGEQCVILVQNLILVLLLWVHSKPGPSLLNMLLVSTTLGGIAAGSFFLPAEHQYILPLTTLPLMIYSRMAQIISNFQYATTGSQSIITTFLMLGGSLARLLTTIIEVGWDVSLLTVTGISAALSAILMGQVRPERFRVIDVRFTHPLHLNFHRFYRSFTTTTWSRRSQRMRRRSNNETPDIIICQVPMTFFLKCN